ncbi:hypothetical protein NQ315_010409 [Exocentrus adspersus]|uniref:Uncharacterized protein n=1 Tax=Exocentrus adspersus TaxID=1586481 RepID=A0AAV8WCC9_9CUCU|nr:hypothetical protein NQ315_010409 [Exocentrus adspersus]
MQCKVLFILALCVAFPICSFQQYRPGNNIKGNEDLPKRREPSNWKAILIIVLSVLFVGAIIYGTSCFYVCQMYLSERTEKKYTKMDSIVHV